MCHISAFRSSKTKKVSEHRQFDSLSVWIAEYVIEQTVLQDQMGRLKRYGKPKSLIGFLSVSAGSHWILSDIEKKRKYNDKDKYYGKKPSAFNINSATVTHTTGPRQMGGDNNFQ